MKASLLKISQNKRLTDDTTKKGEDRAICSALFFLFFTLTYKKGAWGVSLYKSRTVKPKRQQLCGRKVICVCERGSGKDKQVIYMYDHQFSFVGELSSLSNTLI